MSELLHDLSAPRLAAAIEQNLVARFVHLSRAAGIDLHETAEAVWFITGMPDADSNNVLHVQLPLQGIDDRIEAVLAEFKLRQVPMMWTVGPLTVPSDLGKYLGRHGLVHLRDSPGMARDLWQGNDLAPSPSPLIVERVRDAQMMAQWFEALRLSFQFPEFLAANLYQYFSSEGSDDSAPVRNYVGFLRGEPVASATLFLAVGVAGLYNVGTLPAIRRQGIGAAMTVAALREARDAGYRVAVLQSSELGLGVYQRVGFKEYCKLRRYLWAGGANHS